MTFNDLKRAGIEAGITILESEAAAYRELLDGREDEFAHEDFSLREQILSMQINKLRKDLESMEPSDNGCHHIWTVVGPADGPFGTVCRLCGGKPVPTKREPSKLQQAYARGYDAYRRKVSRLANPFKSPLGMIRSDVDLEWERGWLKAEECESHGGLEAPQIAKANIDLTLKTLDGIPMVPISGDEARYHAARARFDGKVTRFEGIPITANPFDKGDQRHDAWLEGWKAGDGAAKNGESGKYMQGYRSFAKGIRRTTGMSLMGQDAAEWCRGWDAAKHECPKVFDNAAR